MSNNIVVVNVSEQIASTPSTLQKTGAFVSQGGTTLAAGTSALITQMADLTAILQPSVAITSISWTSGTVTVQTSAAHRIPAGAPVQGVIANVVPSGYNGVFACTEVDPTHFTYPLASNPGVETTLGTFQLESVSELVAMGDTFFAQGSNQAVYVLELGPGGTAAGVTALGTYLANPTLPFYSYLIPQTWDTENSAPTLFRQYDNPTAKTYFFVTTTTGTYSPWTTTPTKSVFLVLESPSAPATEFSAAAIFQATLQTDPGPVSLVAPLSFRYLFGVTAYSSLTQSQITTLTAAGLNWVGTGAEGGISNTLVINGQFGDLNPWNYWYSVDWMIIQQDLALSGAVINGSNNPTNPLYYNQQGINRLLKVAQQVTNNGIAFGLVLAPATVTAVPFATYIAEEPGDYAIGKYAGLALSFTPARGFKQIVVNLTVSNIAAG
jgi:hypothetical protein